jgi:hypothetical protein
MLDDRGINMHDDMYQMVLTYLYKELKSKKVALTFATHRENAGCKECQDAKNLRTKIEILEWLIEKVIMIEE